MTKGELLKHLKPWPKNTIIEVSISRSAGTAEDQFSLQRDDKYWVELVGVEKIGQRDQYNTHCLLHTGRIVME